VIRPATKEPEMPADAITIRRAVLADDPQLRRLALLDSARALSGTVLVAESDGALRAAWSVEERRAIADPFEPTADRVALLRARAEGARSRPRRRLAPKRLAFAR